MQRVRPSGFSAFGGTFDEDALRAKLAEVDEEALLEGVFGGADGDDEMVTL